MYKSNLALERDTPPECFGSWSPGQLACAGGIDPVYRDELNSSHKRPRCGFFDACGEKKQAQELETRQLLSPARLLRPTAPPQSNFLRSFTSAFQPTAPAPVLSPIRPGPSPLTTAPKPATPTYYTQPQPLGHVFPPYLSVPEPRGDSFMHFVGRTLLRTVVKSIGHALAHLIDTNTIGRE